ncbi:MAG: hypothetical protein JXR83_05835 [Deltaproteobacteria bacterium]|nr:hypothetical protein [Deltaproteobacteria bacterium]
MRGLARYLLPSLADVIFVCLLLAVLAGSGERLLADCDTGYHVRAGEFMLATGTVPRHDIFSFHDPAPRWVAFEWLSQVMLALGHRWHGLDGVVGLSALLPALTFCLLYRALRLRGGSALVAVAVVALAVATSALHWLARPHLFSLLLTALWLGVLEGHRSGRRNRLAWLPPLMLAWVNLHAAFVVGLALIAIYLVGALARHLGATGDERARTRAPLRALSLTLAACGVAALVNPNGIQALLHPLASLGSSFTMGHVGEFRSPDFHDLASAPFALMLLSLIALLARSDRKPGLEQTLLVVAFGCLALRSQRHIPFFALVAAPALVDQLDALLARHRGRAGVDFIERRSRTLDEVDGAARGHLWIAAAIALAALLIGGDRLGRGFDVKSTPAAAARFLLAEPIAGNVFNEYEFGDYLVYSSWPRYRVFIDGRADMYGEALLRQYYQVARLQPGWRDVLERYDVDWVLFTADSALSRALLLDPAWRLVHADPVANIFARDTAENRALIERHPGVEPVPVTGASNAER